MDDVMTPDPISRNIILDTSVFFVNVPLKGNLYTVQKVLNELKDLRGKARLEVLLSQGLVIGHPSLESIRQITDAAEKTGDQTALSLTDIDLLSLAFELKGEIFTDDFALQNTAQYLKIPVHPIIQKKAEMRRWKLRCAGCGKYFNEMPPDSFCQICGSEVRRKNK